MFGREGFTLEQQREVMLLCASPVHKMPWLSLPNIHRVQASLIQVMNYSGELFMSHYTEAYQICLCSEH